MLKNKGYKFRIYPNKKQELQIQKTFGCCRFIYNKMLEDKINAYKNDGISLKVNPSSYKKDFPFLKEVYSWALCAEWNHLNSAYNNFFRNKKVGFPKFKSKKYSKKTFSCSNDKTGNNFTIRFENNKLRIPTLGLLKIKKQREIVGTIKSITISQNSVGNYFVSITTEYEWEKPNVGLNKNKSLGLDYSSHDFYVDSEGNRANYPKYFRLYEDKLAKEQRKLSRMKYDSKNYNKQRIKVAKVHEKITNSRKDFCHKLSYNLAESYDYIFIEDLNLQSVAQSLKLGKATNDNGFGMFKVFLQYKLEDRGKILQKIGKFTPTSIVCSNCGCYHKDIVNSLSIREWTCPDCGITHNRDINAAINIKNIGLTLV